jgi:flavin-dependent dehydrogenase
MSRRGISSRSSRRGKGGRRLGLEDGGRIAVIGGGPAGSLMAYFLLRFAADARLDLAVDVYELRDFERIGPRGCNMCGGLVAGPLVELLRNEGITVPPGVVHNEIDGYSLSTIVGRVEVVAPSRRPSALAVYRGGGPRDGPAGRQGFDAFLLDLAIGMGAKVIRQRVTTVGWVDDRPEITIGGVTTGYDLIVAAIGVNVAPGRLLDDLGLPSSRPRTTRAYVTELRSHGADVVATPDSAMGIVLTGVPGVDALGVIPKGGYATLCALGPRVDRATVGSVLAGPLIGPYRPDDAPVVEGACHCMPNLNVRAPSQPFTDRVVLVGDCGATRLYKDGLGSAFRTARAAAWTAVHRGISADDLRAGYWPVYRDIVRDNRYGRIVFALLRRLQSSPRLLHASLRVVAIEQRSSPGRRSANGIIWDIFTGGAPYHDILLRSCSPTLALRIGSQLLRGLVERPAVDPGPWVVTSTWSGMARARCGTRGSPGAEHVGLGFGEQ